MQGASYNAFVPVDGRVDNVNNKHVIVERQVTHKANGVSVKFVKTFRPNPDFDHVSFNTHEAELLLNFRAAQLNRVAQAAQLTWTDNGTFERIETLDAGPSLDHWMQVKPQAADGRPLADPLAAPAAFFLVMRAALLALQEFHEHGFVHCDINRRNLCLPFVRHRSRPSAFTPDWNSLSLIDFAFSFSPACPLRVPLPVSPDPEQHSPAFMEALDADYKAGNPRKVHRLDGRIDLYALGLMAMRMLDRLEPGWRGMPFGDEAQEVGRKLAGELCRHDAQPDVPAPAGLHRRLLEPVDAFLARCGALHYPEFEFPGAQPSQTGALTELARGGAGQGVASATAAAATPLRPSGAAAPTPLRAGTPLPRSTPLNPAAAVSAPTPTRPTPLNTAAASPTPLRSTPLNVATAAPPTTPMRPTPPVRRPPLPAPQLAPPQSKLQSLPRPPVPQPVSTISSIPAAIARAQPVQVAAARSDVFTKLWRRMADAFALERWRRAAARGEAEACYRMGGVVLRGIATRADPAAALQWFLVAARQGHGPAQAAAASCYDVGYGTTQNDTEALYWYTTAAGTGDPMGHHGLGMLMAQGRGGYRDDPGAAYHFLIAAEAGIAEAWYALGHLILFGQGVVHDRGDAITCFLGACSLGHGASAYALGILSEQSSPGELPDPQAAKLWHQRAVHLGYSQASAELTRLQALYPS